MTIKWEIARNALLATHLTTRVHYAHRTKFKEHNRKEWKEIEWRGRMHVQSAVRYTYEKTGLLTVCMVIEGDACHSSVLIISFSITDIEPVNGRNNEIAKWILFSSSLNGTSVVCLFLTDIYIQCNVFIPSKWKKRAETDLKSLDYYLATMISTSVRIIMTSDGFHEGSNAKYHQPHPIVIRFSDK